MAVLLRQFGSGQISAGTNTVDPLYTAVGTGKAQLIKNMRFTNKHATASVTLNIYLGPSGTDRLISPQNLSLGPNQIYIDDGEIILEATHRIKVTTGSTGGPVDWVVSGVERDQS